MKKLLLFIITIIAFIQITNAQEELEPEFIDYYMTYRSGERATGKVSPSDKVIFLHIITKRAIGDKIVLNIDEDIDYFYKKQYFKAGSSFKFPVKKDVEKIKLVIFNRSNKKHVKRKSKALKEK